MPRLIAFLALGLIASAPAMAQLPPAENPPALPGAPVEPQYPAVEPPPGAIFPSDKPPQHPSERSGEAQKPAQKLSRSELLAELYGHLATAQDATQAEPIAESIEALWLQSGSDTVGILMTRSATAINDDDHELALQFLDAVVELAPAYAEGWNRRAYVNYLLDNYEGAVGDLRRALALEPKHFKALDGLARILRETGQKKAALQAYKEILKINPNFEGAKTAAEELSVEVEGQGI